MNAFWNEFVQLFNTNPPLIIFLWTVISFALGTWFGHWLAQRRDRRKEFNAVCDPIELELRRCLKQLRAGDERPMTGKIDFDSLSLHLPRNKKQAYADAVERYYDALLIYRGQYPSGQLDIRADIPEAIAAIEDLFTYVKHR
ncbi:hypothetical protein RDT67_25210 [Serratia fonticola]|uniref:Uncharacterized protein n=1 Tax=Serratia fonticola TaxID=47917 RepID=A0AAJ1YG70_SERFO|nr:hypothetical protein [Serratia fonticola]MDQ9129720.1 hypothetical protein [Serratia fonticola]